MKILLMVIIGMWIYDSLKKGFQKSWYQGIAGIIGAVAGWTLVMWLF
jgi:uncharacterized BrkB/YihY/UPF0761 family membrane protein